MWPFNKAPAAPADEVKSLGNPTPELLEIFGAPADGTSISNTEALQVPAVSAAVRLISEAAASMEIKLKKKAGTSEEDVTDHPALNLLTGQANGWTSGYELIRDLVASALTKDAGGLAYVTKVSNEPREVIIYQDSIISVDYDSKTGEPRYTIGGTATTRDKILHLRGPFTRSPLSLARSAIGTAAAMEAYANGLWTNGARPGGVIESPKAIGSKSAVEILAGWKAAFSGKSNAGKTGLLWDGMTYRQMAMTSVDGQFNESRTFQILEISRAFRVPPGLLYELTRNTWATNEAQAKEFITYTLIPWLRVLEGAFNRTLLTPKERKDHRFSFDIDDASQADLTARATAISTLITARVLNPNEARNWLGMPPRDGGEEFTNPAIEPAAPTPEAANDNQPLEQEPAIAQS